MKTKNNFLILILLLTMQLSAQTWDVFIGNQGTKENGVDILETYDKGILYMITHSGTAWFVKTTINGDTLWKKKLIGNEYISPKSIIKTSDNGYAFLGATPIEGSFNAFVVKFNKCFEKEWCRILPIEYSGETPYSILENSDNILLINTLIASNYAAPINLYALNLSGDFLWAKNYVTSGGYPDFNNQVLYTIKEINGAYYGVGDCGYPDPTIPDHFILTPIIVKIDANFEEEWVIFYGSEDVDFAGGLNDINLPIDEDNFILSGSRNANTTSLYDKKPLIVKTNANGDDLGYHHIENDSIQAELHSSGIKAINLLEDGKILSSGTFRFSDNLYEQNFGEIVFDTSGHVYHFKNFPNYINAYVRLEKTSDGYYLEGATYDYQNGDWDAYLHKHDANLTPAPQNTEPIEYDYLCPDIIQSEDILLDDCIPVGVEDLPTPKEYYSYIATIPIHIYPNPASNIVHFELENTEHHKNILLQVYDLRSRPVFQTPIAKGQATAQTDVSHWASGMYAVVVFSNGKVVGRKKFVVR